MTKKSIISELGRLHTALTIRYLIAISLVAVLSVVAFLTMDSVIKGMDNNALLVNMSGKQRMLSQYIALDAYRVYSADSSNLYDAELALVKNRLQRNLAEMKVANEILSKGEVKKGVVFDLSPQVQDLYFGEINLKYRVQQYLALVNLILVLPNQEQKKIIIQDIEFRSDGILRDLDKVVELYQKEGEDSLQNVKELKLLLLIVTLIVLFLEVLFIFRPMVRHIMGLSKQNAEALDNLEDVVAIRTKHLEEVNQQLDELAQRDALTGLRNRLKLESNIEVVIEASRQHGDEYAVLMLDVDWFKKTNDQYGHDAGDYVLKEMSSILCQVVREGDHVYRAGGEEFVILLNHISHENAIKKAEQIRQAIEDNDFSYNETDIHKTISGGLYHSASFKLADVKSVLKLVDNALYQAKNEGRNRIVEVSSPTIS
ncbi:MAG: two-component system, cell cycle response regulator [Thiomicrorhabdus sp.]|nr:MAG: two-component system, cell cycle response regulator [Thiomicrorhabdus sp.]